MKMKHVEPLMEPDENGLFEKIWSLWQANGGFHQCFQKVGKPLLLWPEGGDQGGPARSPPHQGPHPRGPTGILPSEGTPLLEAAHPIWFPDGGPTPGGQTKSPPAKGPAHGVLILVTSPMWAQPLVARPGRLTTGRPIRGCPTCSLPGGGPTQSPPPPRAHPWRPDLIASRPGSPTPVGPTWSPLHWDPHPPQVAGPSLLPVEGPTSGDPTWSPHPLIPGPVDMPRPSIPSSVAGLARQSRHPWQP
ncbi:proline-rich protein 2-like [Macrobrachium nipponense]|uniref:proline-rich protein 2-like n=1 Tax=Macrobrachium nipponense TaxID=159736 RepID=UPI0030C84C97